MQDYNSNRRKFNLFGDEKLTEINSNPSNGLKNKQYINPHHSHSTSNKENGYLANNSYGYIKFKTSTSENDKNSKIQERFMYIILIAAIVIAFICTILSIASMIMFFTL